MGGIRRLQYLRFCESQHNGSQNIIQLVAVNINNNIILTNENRKIK